MVGPGQTVKILLFLVAGLLTIMTFSRKGVKSLGQTLKQNEAAEELLHKQQQVLELFKIQHEQHKEELDRLVKKQGNQNLEQAQLGEQLTLLRKQIEDLEKRHDEEGGTKPVIPG
eukprot:TRINITY_DN4046_c5_g1_i1.p2 TRINITY_DN4046_c5_g1~~TRINITY_DN4046_c5_g1_i1.p2  ORF type:complete len:128 (+),score=31.48 TRINITY_DN4046_c5_g1_i1:41-385(+)